MSRTTARSAVPEIAVAVISFNTRDVLRDCLSTVVAESPVEVVVVDNGSTDGSVEMLRDEFPTARLVVDPSNPGYGAASNHAVDACAAPYVLLLNSDTLLRRGTLEALHSYMEGHPRAGIAGPRLVNADGSLQRSCFAFPSTAFLIVEHTPLRAAARVVPGLRSHFLIDSRHDEARAVPWVSGAALVLRRSAFEQVGGFDPSFHMYFEETDLAWRLAEAGWETHFAPVADVVHLGGASTAGYRAAMKARYFRSMIQFVARHRTRAAAARLVIAMRFFLGVRLVLDTLRRPFVRDGERRREIETRIEVARRLVRASLAPDAAPSVARTSSLGGAPLDAAGGRRS